ncbi:uncharacterized protein N7473_005442 [Penicillium subrubescens]|uniref:Zn(2)-C6 fungal-type domain-containing protein n=1 Tax=Penicillium subrubescens TaxID=1316194 RepID=A0A1Q5UR38_9EURO|nr:uncharacterized protein N7473_005442 [Penicillium subrubescens]KAJ5896043.1 hypothetical protein N7473_005442 [Penicillium subrubescens]OKP14931.1 hypothetical protein PENSUB_5091 [Penicillium subrubescens]
MATHKKAPPTVLAPPIIGESETENHEPANSRKRPAARGTAFYPRKRANAACQVCRARKTKCDNQKPTCSYCLSVGAVCNQTAEDLSSFDPASLKILERLDVLERLMRQQGVQPTTSLEPTSSLAQQQGHGSDSVASSTLGESRHKNIRLNDPPSKVPSRVHSGQDTLIPSVSGENTPLLGALPESPDRLLCLGVFQKYRFNAGFTNKDSSWSHWAEKPTQKRRNSATRDRRGARLLDDNLSERRGVNELLDSFFTFVHCKNPILKEAPTRRLVLSKAAHGVDESGQSCLAFLVCALGHLATPFGENPDIQKDGTGPDSAVYSEAEVLFHEAQSRMGPLLVNNEADHLIVPQCLILSGLYKMCTFRPFLAWQFFVQALAASQQFAFLRKMYNDEYISSIHESEREERIAEPNSQEQAVYWTAWKSERELRRCLCLPDFPATGDTSRLYPPLFPTPPEIASNDSVDQRRERASWLFYLAEISLRRLQSNVCDEILSLYRTEKSEASFLAHLATLVPEYEQQGRRWAASLPPELSLQEPAESDDICRFVLRGHYIDYCEAIYWPFLASRLNNFSSVPSVFSPQSSASQPILSPQHESIIHENTSAALEIRSPKVSQYSPSSSTNRLAASTAVVELAAKCLEIQLRRLHINYPGFTHRHHGTFLLIWSCTRSALVLLAASLTGLVMPSGWLEGITWTAELLSLWKDEMPQLSKWRDLLTWTVSDIPEGTGGS